MKRRVPMRDPRTHCDVRDITVGNIHAERGDPHKVAELCAWLMNNPARDLPPLDVREKPNGTYRIHDGRHRFLAYVLAERAKVPILVGTGGVMELQGSARRRHRGGPRRWETP